MREINATYGKLEHRLINIAREMYLCSDDDHKKFHVSFICHGPRIIATGFNQSKKSSTLGMRTKTRYHSIHSEASAYLSIRWNDQIKWNKIDFFNIKVGNEIIIENGIKVPDIRMAAPCPSCQMLLSEIIGIKKCHYTNGNGEFETIKF